MKTCSKCGEEKPLTDFFRRSDQPGFRSHCKVCTVAASRQRIRRLKAQHGHTESAKRRLESYALTSTTVVVVDPEHCNFSTHAARKAKRRKEVDTYKRWHGCIDCGTKVGRLELDHRPFEDKRFNVAHGVGYSPEVLWAEVAKCDVRCAYCHRQRHSTTRAAA